MGFVPDSVRVMGARATESGQNAWEKSKDKYTEISAIVRADLRGWLVCLAVLVITVVRSGITYSFGMFVVELEKAFPDMTMAEQSKQHCSSQHPPVRPYHRIYNKRSVTITTLKSHKYLCITTYQSDAKSNPNSNPTTKQHVIVKIQLISHMSYASRYSYEICCCTVCTTLGCYCQSAYNTRSEKFLKIVSKRLIKTFQRFWFNPAIVVTHSVM